LHIVNLLENRASPDRLVTLDINFDR